MYQIVEFLFWKNKLLTGNISLNVLKINKCVLYQNKDIRFLLPNLTILIKTNILSMHSRLIDNFYNKCAKDYHRLKYLYDVSRLPFNNIEDIIDDMIMNVKKIYEKENPNLFKLPYSICSLDNNNDEDKNNIYKLYKKFINLDLKEQIKLMLLNNNVDDDMKNEFNEVINRQK